jgi:hypothetical protein
MNDENALHPLFSANTLLKATPSEDGGRRFIYFEASNEGVDQQGERVLAKALEESAAHFLRFGNLDIDHYTLIGRPNPAKGWPGLPNPEQYEIGKPVDVRVSGSQTFVKAELYQGDTELARNANMVWDSMTKLSPPKNWYPSVGGAVLAKSEAIDPDSKRKVDVVTRVRWTNLAISQTPVNQHVQAAQVAPVAVFTKSLNGFVIATSLEAGYGADVSSLTGGSALRIQSLDGVPASYFDYRDRLAGAVRSREAKLQTRNGLIDYSVNKFNLSADEATEWVDRFLNDLKRKLN